MDFPFYSLQFFDKSMKKKRKTTITQQTKTHDTEEDEKEQVDEE